MHEARVEQRLHDDGDAADAVDVGHHEPAEGLEVADVRDLAADAVEVVEGQVDLGLAGDGEQVEDGVGRSAQRHDDGDGVLEGRLGHDLAGGDALAQHADDGLARAVREAVSTSVHGRGRGTSGQAHADRLGDTGHRVGGVHASARALARTDRTLDAVDLLAGDLAGQAGADGLEGVDDRDVVAVDLTGHGRAGVEEDTGQVESRRRHQHPRERLVAACEQHRAVEPLRHHHRLDRVRDDLAADQREVHALVAHRDAVGDRDRPELQWIAATGVHAVLDRLGEAVEREVAGRDLVPAGRDTDLGLGPVVVTHAHRTQHPARSSLLESVRDVAGTGLQVGLIGGVGHDVRLAAGCASTRGVSVSRHLSRPLTLTEEGHHP